MEEKNTNNNSLETSLERVQQIVKELEESKTSLEGSFKLYEEGIHLVNQVQSGLTEYEKRIEILTKAGPNGVETKPYESSND